jgi:hypothetical protein
MSKRSWRLILALVFLAASLTLLAWSLLPSQRIVRRQLMQPTEMQLPASDATLPETRILTLDYPAAIRVGDVETARLTFVPETDFPNLPSVYADYNVLAEARLDLPGARPANTVSEPLLPGQKVTFYWSLRPTEAGKYRGTVWFYLRFIPKTTGKESRIALSSQPVEIDVTDLFGLQPGAGRWLGVLGLFIGVVLGFPFLERALKSVWGTVHKKAGDRKNAPNQ